jgi:hypothetical protein
MEKYPVEKILIKAKNFVYFHYAFMTDFNVKLKKNNSLKKPRLNECHELM